MAVSWETEGGRLCCGAALGLTSLFRAICQGGGLCCLNSEAVRLLRQLWQGRLPLKWC